MLRMPNTSFKVKQNNNDQKLQTTIRLESKTFAQIDKIMLTHGVSRAEVIRRLLKKSLQNYTLDFSGD